ncbi:MAG: DMT family transporter [Gammaproteobacteria bacterium]|nr:DMT family transporter [Gammaproteobacteria bacterium]
MANRSFLANLAAAVAALSAGACVVATRLAIGETDPATLAFYRYIIGMICFAPILPFIWPKTSISISEYGKIALLGALFFGLFPWAFNASLQYIPAARGAIGLATIPIQTLIVAVIFGRERLTSNKIISVGLAFAGIAVVFGPEAMNVTGTSYLFGDGLMLLGALSAAIYSVFSRATLNQHGPLFVTALAMLFGVLSLSPLVVLGTDTSAIFEISQESMIALLFLGTFGGALQFSLFTWALRWLQPTRTVIYLTLNPISAMLLAVIILGESVTPILIVGLVLVFAGIFVGSFSGKWRFWGSATAN